MKPRNKDKCPNLSKKVDGFGWCGECGEFHYKKSNDFSYKDRKYKQYGTAHKQRKG